MENNELTNAIHTTLCPRAVLIAYTYAGDNKYFLEQRSIDARGRMGEGHPVTVEFMNGLVRERPTAGCRPTCCMRIPAREARDTSGTILPGNGGCTLSAASG